MKIQSGGERPHFQCSSSFRFVSPFAAHIRLIALQFIDIIRISNMKKMKNVLTDPIGQLTLARCMHVPVFSDRWALFG